MKYFWEISVPDSAYERFLSWLEKCEDAYLTFAFVVIKRYEGHRILYGFSNFEILEDESIKCFDFKFENDDILSDKFRAWMYESICFLIPFSLLGYFKVIEAISKEASKIRLINNDVICHN